MVSTVPHPIRHPHAARNTPSVSGSPHSPGTLYSSYVDKKFTLHNTACRDSQSHCITLATKVTLTNIISSPSTSLGLLHPKLKLCKYCCTESLPEVHARKLLRTCTYRHITPCLFYTCRQVSSVIDMCQRQLNTNP